MGYYRVTEKRDRQHQFDSQGRRVFADIAGLGAEEHAWLRARHCRTSSENNKPSCGSIDGVSAECGTVGG